MNPVLPESNIAERGRGRTRSANSLSSFAASRLDRKAASLPLKSDPYANRRHWRIDIVLCIGTLLILFFVLLSSAHGQEVRINGNAAAAAGKGHHPHYHANAAGNARPAPTPIDAQKIWNNSSANWNGASAWTPAGAPNAGDVAAFTLPQINPPTLGSDVNIAGLYFTGTATGYTISGNGRVITLTASGTTIGAETGDATAVAIGQDMPLGGTNSIAPDIILAPSTGTTSTVDIETGTLTISGAISGTGINLSKTGTGTLVLSGASTYSGTTTINAGTLTLDSAGSTTARLAGTTNITVNSGGTLLLANSSGTTSNDRINNAATMTLNGGTFNTGGLSEHGASNNTAGIGALTLSTSSIIDMGSGSSIIAFADSHLVSWTGTLNIYNWSGTLVTGGGMDQLYFGSTSSGLTPGQLAQIQFYADAGSTFLGTAIILSTGEVIPTAVPEPGTWCAAALALAVLSYSQRKRLRRVLIKA